MNSQAHGKYPKDCSQLCHHGFQIRTWFPTCLVYPPAWPQQGLLPCLRWEGVGAAPREAGQRPSCSISSWRDSHPTPTPAALYSWSPPFSGWPACPAPLPGSGWALVHLSGTRRLIKSPRKQGQRAGAEEGAALGHVWLQGFFGPCSNLPPERQGPGHLTWQAVRTCTRVYVYSSVCSQV